VAFSNDATVTGQTSGHCNVLQRFELTNRTAIITGGAGLMGIQHAVALCDAGARCILVDINEAKLNNAVTELQGKYGQRVVGRVCDITKKEDVIGLLQYSLELWNSVEILINNAALNPQVSEKMNQQEFSRLENFSVEQWNRELSVGLTGAFLCSQVIGSDMARKGKGVILNIASDLAIIAPDQRLYQVEGLPADRQPVKPVTYSVVKTGLLGLTRYLSTYWAHQNVRVNSISPGGIFTNQPQEFVNRLSSLIPMGRMAQADEYQATVLFLVSDASSYLTGTNIVADGGRTVW